MSITILTDYVSVILIVSHMPYLNTCCQITVLTDCVSVSLLTSRCRLIKKNILQLPRHVDANLFMHRFFFNIVLLQLFCYFSCRLTHFLLFSALKNAFHNSYLFLLFQLLLYLITSLNKYDEIEKNMLTR